MALSPSGQVVFLSDGGDGPAISDMAAARIGGAFHEGAAAGLLHLGTAYAVCSVKRAISPLQVKDEVDVFRMAPEEECEKEMFVMIRWEKGGLAVPLSQITAINSTDEQTKQAVEDWHYWLQMGYPFG